MGEDEPDVDYLNVISGWKHLYDPDEDGGQDQHGGQVDTQGSLEEIGFKEGCGLSDQDKEKGWKVGCHHFVEHFPLEDYGHPDPLPLVVGARRIYILQG